MISLIVPIYNASPYLPACLAGLLGQSVSDLQIILVDDGSTDDSLVIARQIASKDPRVQVWSSPHKGQSAARNIGLQHATGEFIAFVDADDTIEADWCERHLAAIEGVDYVQSGYKRVEGLKAKGEKAQLPRNNYQFTSPCMRLYRREAIDGLRFEEGMIYEDVLFSVDLWLRRATCRRIHYAGYLYTLNPQSTTSRPHPEAQQRVIQALHTRLIKADRRGKLIVLYTLCRLKIHFLRS